MTLKDARGLAVSTSSREALDGFELALGRLHTYTGDPLAALDGALAADPGFALAHAFKAHLLNLATEKAPEPLIRAEVEAAEALAAAANERERGHVAAARAWLDGDFERALDAFERVLAAHPRDALALQAAHVGDFFTGDAAELRDRVARRLPAWDAGVPGYGFVLGMHAFGLEECGDYREAEAAGRRAVELHRNDCWAIHAVAHVMEMEGRQRDGAQWLGERTADWSTDNFFQIHNWWHLALFNLDLERSDEVLRLYDERIRAGGSKVVLDMLDAAALLWRLKLAGIDGGAARWAEMADAWAPLAGDAIYAFNDAHAMMAFVGAGREAEQAALLAAMARAAQGRGSNAAMTREIGLPVARAIQASGRGRWGEAANLLEPIRTRLNRFGGSHAQRDLFQQTLVEAALRAGHLELAGRLIDERLAAKPSSPRNWRFAARAATDPAASAKAEEKARSLLS
jgi:tetratricopeptide (TPR) repeat protein